MSVDPETLHLSPDRDVPNSALPTLIYRAALPASPAVIKATFAAHDWRNAWANGVYPFHHFHSTSHEVLGCASGTATLKIGGKIGRKIEIAAGDVLVLPAGVGHKRLGQSSTFQVVGAYPNGRDWDLIKADGITLVAFAEAQRRIAKVPLPPSDPVYGTDGPLIRLWGAVAH